MKRLLRDIFTSWHTWLLIGSILLATVGTIVTAMSLQRSDYRHQIDASTAAMIGAMRDEIRKLEAENDHRWRENMVSKDDRVRLDGEQKELKDKVDETRANVKYLRDVVQRVEAESEARRKAREKQQEKQR